MRKAHVLVIALLMLSGISALSIVSIKTSSLNTTSATIIRAPLWSYQTGNDVVSVSISRDGKYIAAGSFDNEVYLFDRDSSVPIWNHSCSKTIRSVSLASGGDLAFSGDDPKIYFYDRMSGVLHERIAPSSDIAPIFDYPKYVSASSDGRFVAIQFEGRIGTPAIAYVGLWDLLTDHINLTSLAAGINDATIYTAKISSDGWLYFSGYDYYGHTSHYLIFVCEAEAFPGLPSIYDAPQPCRCLAASSDAMYVTAGCDDQYVYFLNRQGVLLWRHFTGASVRMVDMAASGNLIAACSGNMVHLYNKTRNQSVPSPDTVPVWSYDTGNAVQSLAISDDGRYLVAGCIDGTVLYFETLSSNPLWSYQTGEPIRSVDISSDGRFVVVGSEDDKVYLFSSETSSVRSSLTNSMIFVGSNACVTGAVSPIHIGVPIKIYSRISGATDWSILATSITNSSGLFSYTWVATSAGTFEVMTGWDGDADHEPSNSSALLLIVKENQPPTPPQSLTASANFTPNIILTWQPPLSDGGLPIKNYKIYRGTNPNNLTLRETVGNQLLFNDTEISPEHDYYYQVSAVNEAGESPLSNMVEIDHTVIPEFPEYTMPLLFIIITVFMAITRKPKAKA